MAHSIRATTLLQAGLWGLLGIFGLFVLLVRPCEAASSADGDLAASDIRAVFFESTTKTASQNVWSAQSNEWFGSADSTTLMVAQLTTALLNSPYSYPALAAGPQQITYVVHRTNPRYKEEAVLLQTTHWQSDLTGVMELLSLYVRSDKTAGDWQLKTIIAGSPTAGATLHSWTLSGDIAYERKTGRLVFVHVKGGISHQPYYEVWSYNPAGASRFETVDAAVYASVPTSSAGSHEVGWVKLVPHPSTDDMLLFWECVSGELFSLRWQPSSKDFGPLGPAPLEKTLSKGWLASPGNYDTVRGFDAAIEASGRALVIYGNRVNDTVAGETAHVTTVRYRTLRLGRQAGDATDSSWSKEASLKRILDNTATRRPSDREGPSMLALSVEPGGNRIAAGIYIGDNATGLSNRVYGAVWDGNLFPANDWASDSPPAAWLKGIHPPTDAPVMDGGAPVTEADAALIATARTEQPVGSFPVAVAWIGTPQTWGVLAYGAESGTGLDWALFAPSGSGANTWMPQATAAPSSNEEVGVMMDMLPDKQRLMYIATRYNGSKQEAVAVQLTKAASAATPPTWGSAKVLTTDIAYVPSSNNARSYFPVGFGISLGFPRMTSAGAAVQYLAINPAGPAGAQVVKAITIEDRAGLITKNAGIRLIIPSQLNMEWDVNACPSPTSLKITGNASGKLSTDPLNPTTAGRADPNTVPVCAQADPGKFGDSLLRVLRIGVFDDFTVGNTLTIEVSGVTTPAVPLRVRKLNAVSDAAYPLGLDITGENEKDVDDEASIWIVERVEVKDHPGGQAPNAFVNSNLPVIGGDTANVPLLRFRLQTEPTGPAVKLHDLTLQFTPTGTITPSTDLQNLKLSSSIQLTAGGATELSTFPSGTTAQFSFQTLGYSPIIPPGGADFVLTGEVLSVDTADRLKITATATTMKVQGSGTSVDDLQLKGVVTGTIEREHRVATYTITMPANIQFGAPLMFSWTAINTQPPPANGGFAYSVNGGGAWSAPFDCTIIGTSCTTAEPTSNRASADAKIKILGLELNSVQPAEGVSSSFVINETLMLTADQVGNAFASEGNASGLRLFQFKGEARGGDITLNSVSFQLNGNAIGKLTASSAVLQVGGQTFAPATPPSAPGGVLTLDFNGLPTGSKPKFARDQAVDITLLADFVNLQGQDALTVDLSGLTGAGQYTNGQPVTVNAGNAIVGLPSVALLGAGVHTLVMYQVTLPGNDFTVGQQINVQFARVPPAAADVVIEYSADGTFSAPVVVGGPLSTADGSGTFPWTIDGTVVPISGVGTASLRVRDATGPALGRVDSLTVRAGIQINPLTSPVPAGSILNIPFTLQGDMQQLQVLPIVNGTADPGHAFTIVSPAQGATVYPWTVPADIAPEQFPQANVPFRADVPLVLRLSDATPGHAPASSDSNSTTVIYYRINWHVVDLSNGTELPGLQVTEGNQGTGAATWVATGVFSPMTRSYAVGTYSTTFEKNGYNPGGKIFAAGTTIPGCPDAGGIPQCTVVLESQGEQQVPVNVSASFDYDAAVNAVNLSTWLMRRGLLLSDFLVSTQMDIFDDTRLVRTLTSATPEPLPGDPTKSTGRFNLVWDLKDSAGVDVPTEKTYFAHVTIARASSTYTGAQALNIAVPKKILTNAGGSGSGSGGVTLTELQTELQPIKAATVGPGATLATTIGGQISAAQNAIQADVALVKTDTGAILGDTNAIRADTGNLITQVDGVQAYLSNPEAGLPKVLANQTAMQDQLKAGRKGKILNRETTIAPDDAVTIYYQPADPATVPTINIFGPSGLLGAGAMTLGADGLYSFPQNFGAGLSLGDYTVVVAEAGSAASNGTVDNMVLRLRDAAATVQNVSDVGTQLTALSTQLSAVETNLAGQMAAIDATMATQTQVDGVVTAVADLQAKWGTLTAADLQNELAALSILIGAPASGSLAGDIAAIPGALNYTARFDALDTAVANLSTQVGTPAQQAAVATVLTELAGTRSDLANLSTQVGTPAQAAALQSVADQVTAVQAAIAALPGAIDYTAQLTALQTSLAALDTKVGTPAQAAALQSALDQLNTLQTAVGSLSTQVGTPAQQAVLDGVVTKLDAMELSMAKEASVQNALTAVGALQTDMTALSAAVGTPAQAAALAAVDTKVDALQAAIASLPGALNYTPRFDSIDTALANLQTAVDAITGAGGGTDLSTIQAALDALALQVGDPAQAAALTGVAAQLTTMQTDMAKEATVANVQTAVGTLQTSVNNLSTQVGTPAQAAALQAVADQVTAVQDAIAALPGAIDYSAQLVALDTKLDALTTAVGTPSQAAAVQAVADQVTALQAALAALPAPVDHTAELAALQTDLTGLIATVDDPAQAAAVQAIADQIAALPGATDYTPQLTALSDALIALQADLASVPRADYTTDITELKTVTDTVQAAIDDMATSTSTSTQSEEILTQLASLQTALDALSAGGGSGTTAAATTTTTTEAGDVGVLAKLEELQKAINSAQGSSAATGFAQSAFNSANEAVTILKQLQADAARGGAGSSAGVALLGQLGEKFSSAKTALTVIPGNLEAEELSAQLKELAKRTQGVATDKGYKFDSLYELSETQATDVKTMRNQVEELKQLIEVQRAILEKNVNQPVMKTWFEAN